ncbi:MAG TPA: baseplate J/gp47 family protein, partial [Terriglobales bacterium]
ALQRIREKSGFTAMVRFALGEDPNQSDPSAPLERLKPFVLRDADFATLQAASTGPADQQDWSSIYAIVEVAQRNREGMSEPLAQRVDWLNLYPADDATKQVVVGFEGSTDLPRWRTFGMPAADSTPDNPPTSLLGWAINSPLLAMSEGARTITLTLGFRPEQFDKNKLTTFLKTDPIRFEISTAKGWKEVSVPVPVPDTYAKLTGTTVADLMGIQWKLVSDETVDAFAPPPAGEVGDGSTSPVLRLTLRQVWDPDAKQFTMPYPALADLLLVTVLLKVEVVGLKTLSIANDETTLDPKKPFLPFGSSPTNGARFYLGHPEIVTKKLDSLTFNLEWLGAPSDFPSYYKNYGVAALSSPGAFTAKISLADQRANRSLVDKAALFANPATNPSKIPVSLVPSSLPPGYVYDRLSGPSLGTDLLAWNRYFVWELNAPDFQHQAYPAVAAGKAIDLSAAMSQAGGLKTPDSPANYKINPPYTPKLKTLTADYAASLEIRTENSGPGSMDRMFHIHPFGYSYAAADPTPAGFSFLPRYENQGELYVGLQNVASPLNVAILFQAAEGSADPDLAAPAIAWSVLDGDQWIDLDKSQVLVDTTRGLINTGILEFDLPAVAPSLRLPGGFYWIRAAAATNSTAVCDAIALHTQAVTATLVNTDAAPDHFATPLPSASIKKFAPPIAGIAGVRQPYTSSGGRVPEQDSLFYTRVSERLRHKQRALTAWDYERLVLARFPEIYKVKCVPASLSRNPDDPGSVRLVVIPDIRNKRPFDPFEPKAPADMLANIQEFLADKVPVWAAVSVGNPHYVAVKLRLAVRFSVSGDEDYYKNVLNDDLNRFLAPWAYAEGADIVIGGRIYANSIVDFVDRRPYIDFVANVELFSSDDGQNFSRVPSPALGDPEGYFIEADRPDGILVAAREHQIDLIGDTGFSVQLLTGIDYMKLELDFVVA